MRSFMKYEGIYRVVAMRWDDIDDILLGKFQTYIGRLLLANLLSGISSRATVLG